MLDPSYNSAMHKISQQQIIEKQCLIMGLLDTALERACNTLYALRDHAIEQGLTATVEQSAIDAIINIRKKVRNTEI